MPRPLRKAVTGACSVSARSSTSLAACCAPAPHMIMGFLAAASSRTAASMACESTGGSGCGRFSRIDDGRGLRRHRVPAHLDGDRAGPAAGRVAKCAIDEPRCVAGRIDSPSVLDQRAQGRELVGQLVQMAASAAQKGRWDLPRETHDGRAVAHGRAQGRRGVQDAGPGNDREDSRAARRFRIAHRHVGGRLLVTRHDELDVGAMEGVEERVVCTPGTPNSVVMPLARAASTMAAPPVSCSLSKLHQ